MDVIAPKETTAPAAATPDSASVDTKTSRKRPLESAGGGDDWIFELRCPITQALPIDPVTAADGRMYERMAYLQYLQGKGPGKIRSPVTGEEMTREFTTSHQMRNTIERLVERQVITGPEADRWKRANKDFKALSPEFRQTAVKAHEGNADAMRDLGVAYRDGTMGVQKDLDKAQHWMMHAALKDDVLAVTHRAVMLTGVSNLKDAYVTMEVTRAAMLGSEHACGQLGYWFSHDGERVNQSKIWAHYWYTRMKTATCKNACTQYRRERHEWFEKHTDEDARAWLDIA